MGGAELGSLWDYKQQQEALAAADTEEARRAREAMRARKEAALAKTEAILSKVGNSIMEEGRPGQRRGAYIPMGQVSGAPEGVEGYARVYVRNDTELEKVTTKGRFFKKVELVPVATDKVSEFGVVLEATQSTVRPEVLQYAYWSIVNQGSESDTDMSQLEGALDLVATHIGLPSLSEAT